MQLAEALGKAIDTLPEKERLAVTLYYYEDFNLKEIGEILGLTESRISQLISQAMVRIRSRFRLHRNDYDEITAKSAGLPVISKATF